MKGWLNTIRWKNILIIWLSILVVAIPHYRFSESILFLEFIYWGIICSSIAAIGNITNDMMDVVQDNKNNKPNIFSDRRNIKTAYGFMFVLLVIISITM